MSPWRLPSHPPAGICCCGDLLPWRLPSRPPAGYPTEMSYITPSHFRLILLPRFLYLLLDPWVPWKAPSIFSCPRFLEGSFPGGCNCCAPTHWKSKLGSVFFDSTVKSLFAAPGISLVQGHVRGAHGSQRTGWLFWQSSGKSLIQIEQSQAGRNHITIFPRSFCA